MSTPDYTGASAQQYIDSYTNRPEDMGTKEGLLGLLDKMSWVTPAGPTIKGLSMLPLMMKGLKVYRGVPKWHRGKMLYKGKYVGKHRPENFKGFERATYVDPGFDDAAKYARNTRYSRGQGVDYPKNANPRVLEFDIPYNQLPANARAPYRAGEEIMFKEGIPKKYLRKVHKLLNKK